MSAVLQKTETQFNRWVTFRLADEIYGINVMQVQEVLRMTEIAPVPGAPGCVIGIINLRGNVVTVVDARELFGLVRNDSTDQTRIMIVEINKLIVGLLVDSVAEVVNIQNSEIDSAPSIGNDDNSRYIQGVYSKNGEILILVDLNRLMTADAQFVQGGF
ncbi:MAG: chemotaxis protein CheW [Gammaproteobacteria bacterium]|jgi:purine-binding chemotaxis protein CheW|nr:chemotaxis protein CheW [Gammaproteobacteria bacterium]